ncbi:MAG TPA: hypothetical protein VH062_12945 [Polyangiaceae bacterium]|jgi:hypothetical protein|nr:hypothetical protein [Polyangiaceae bacterium]
MSRPTTVLKTPFLELEMYYTERVVLVRRTNAPFVRVSDVEGTIEALAKALPLERRSGYGLLVDNRAAPVRADPSLEPAFARYRTEVERGFSRIVVVVETPLGKIRSERLGQTAQVPLEIVDSLEAAWEHLRGG